MQPLQQSNSQSRRSLRDQYPETKMPLRQRNPIYERPRRNLRQAEAVTSRRMIGECLQPNNENERNDTLEKKVYQAQPKVNMMERNKSYDVGSNPSEMKIKTNIPNKLLSLKHDSIQQPLQNGYLSELSPMYSNDLGYSEFSNKMQRIQEEKYTSKFDSKNNFGNNSISM